MVPGSPRAFSGPFRRRKTNRGDGLTRGVQAVEDPVLLPRFPVRLLVSHLTRQTVLPSGYDRAFGVRAKNRPWAFTLIGEHVQNIGAVGGIQNHEPPVSEALHGDHRVGALVRDRAAVTQQQTVLVRGAGVRWLRVGGQDTRPRISAEASVL